MVVSRDVSIDTEGAGTPTLAPSLSLERDQGNCLLHPPSEQLLPSTETRPHHPLNPCCFLRFPTPRSSGKDGRRLRRQGQVFGGGSVPEQQQLRRFLPSSHADPATRYLLCCVVLRWLGDSCFFVFVLAWSVFSLSVHSTGLGVGGSI